MTKVLSKFIITLAMRKLIGIYMQRIKQCVEKEYNDGKIHKGRHTEKVKEDDVEFIRLQFTDILVTLRT